MKQTHYLTGKIQKDHRLEIILPELAEGQTVEIIVIMPQNKTQVNTGNFSSYKSVNIRQNIMKKSLSDRRQILAEQAEKMQEHYEQEKSWQEWNNIDLDQIYHY